MGISESSDNQIHVWEKLFTSRSEGKIERQVCGFSIDSGNRAFVMGSWLRQCPYTGLNEDSPGSISGND